MTRWGGNGGNVVDIGGGGLKMPPIPGGAAGGRAILVVVLGLVLVVTGYYQVEPDEVAVVQRFGRHVRTTGPGPHFKMPFFVETVTKVAVERQHKMEFGFRTDSVATRTTYAEPSAETRGESIMLTGDLNVANVEWIVQYRIKDPVKYLFHIRDQNETFRYMSEASMRQVVGDHSVDEVLTVGREEIARLAKVELQRLCDLYGIGIEVQQLVLQDVNPPDAVKPAFNEVNQAIQEKERAINEAWADYNKSVPLAKGQADQAVRSAEGYALERVNAAEGDAHRFSALYEEYKKAPDVTRRRIHLETLQRVLPKMGRKLVFDEQAKGIVPLLQMGDPIEAAAAATVGGER
jgi:membrane protease subunit HflK